MYFLHITEIPECRNMTCHRNDTQGWRCADVNGAVKCVCAVGYEYDSILEDCEGKKNILCSCICGYFLNFFLPLYKSSKKLMEKMAEFS